LDAIHGSGAREGSRLSARDTRKLLHLSPDARSCYPNEVGSEQVRKVTFSGDGMVFINPARASGGKVDQHPAAPEVSRPLVS
jgi:hypothetical protein